MYPTKRQMYSMLHPNLTAHKFNYGELNVLQPVAHYERVYDLLIFTVMPPFPETTHTAHVPHILRVYT
jgi:hypothetical protein